LRAFIARTFFRYSKLQARIRGWYGLRNENSGDQRGSADELLAWGNTAMEPHLFRIKPRGSSGESYSHEGEEFCTFSAANSKFG